ncbi:MAG: nucleoside 2-deoxyribosyltransferase [Chloroflexi bacterium]|nr:MAG: nucleoside 2-deoxyribosyltransferase [Chloroflexota bacterium]
MKAYLAIKFYEDGQNRDMIEGITAVLAQQGIETICVVRDLEKWGQVHFTPDVLMQKSFNEIDRSDMIIVELSEKGVGIGIEAGYAYAKDIPIITIARTGSDISETLRGISQDIFFYESYNNLTDFF